MKPKFRSLAARVAPLFGLTIVCTLQPLQAASGVWTGTTSGGNWSDIANWSGGTVADGSGSLADFTTLDLPAGAFTVALDSNRTIGSLSTGDTNGGTAGTWSISGTTTLTLDGSPSITANVSTTVAPVLAGTAGFTKSGAANLILTGANTVSGTISLTTGQLTAKNGAALGTSTLNMADGTTYRYERTPGNATTFQGNAITVAAASSATITTDNASNGYSGLISGSSNSTFTIGATGATTQCSFNLGSNTQQFGSFLGRVEIFDGTSIRFSSTSNLSNGGAAAIWDNNTTGNITARNTGTVHLGSLVGSGTVSGSSGATGTTTFSIGGRSEDCTYNGTLIDATPGSRIAALTKVGTATLTLTHASGLSWGGVTNVNEGTLKINGVKSGTAATTVKVGTTIAGTGSIAGITTVQNGGTLAPGDGGVGNITFASLSLATGSTVAVEFGTGNDSATVQTGGTLTLASGVNIDVNGFNTNGSYPIFNVTGATISGTPSAALAIVNGDPGKVYTFSNDANAVYLNISDSDPNNYWKPDSGGTWGAAGNWTKNVVPNAAEASAKIGPGPEGLGGGFTPLFPEITLDAVQTVGEVVINDDFGSKFTIAPGTGGSLLMDNGAIAASIAIAKGSHAISAPIAVDPEDVSFDIAENLELDVSGVVSSQAPGGGVIKAGLGTLSLTGVNTFDGGTTIAAGVLEINGASSLGDAAMPATFTGGTLRILGDLTDVRTYRVSGSSNAQIDTNTFNYNYGGVIEPTGGGTGGLTKTGAGTLTLTAAQTYTGVTTHNGGSLVVSTGGSISGSAMNVTSGTLTVAGGSLTASATSSVTSSGFALSSGSASFATLNGNTGNPSTNIFLNLTGGTFSASTVSMGRCSTAITTLTEGATGSGLYINGASASISGALNVGQNSTGTNSTASARIDSGSLTVDGVVQIAIASPDRWSVLDVNGGTFTSTNVATGVQVGSGQGGNVAFLVRNGTSTVERIILQQPAASVRTSLLNLSGGSLYVGAGGIVGNVNGGTGVLDVQLGTATLGAKASWSSAVAANLNGTTTIKAADALDAPFDISLSGVLSGAGGFTKTGTGTLTLSGANTYTGTTDVTAGTLVIDGDQSAAIGDVITAAGTTLGGNGNIGGNVTIAGNATHRLAVGATPGSQVTRVISGILTLNANNVLDLTAAGPVAGGTYVLATATGGISGSLATVNLPGGVSGSVFIDGNSIKMTVATSGYNTWASTNAGNQTANLDFDFDGVSNGVEYFLNAPAGFTANPGLVSGTVTWTNGGNISHTAYGTEFLVQTSNNLSNWTDVLAGNPNLNNTAGSVSFTPTGPGPVFVRLKVTPN